MKDKRIQIFVFARGGSKGIPNKNIMTLGSTTLLGHSINIAKEIVPSTNIHVSTDSDRIAENALMEGVNVIRRPEHLASDTAAEWDAWKHGINSVLETQGNFDYFVSLPTTAPLRIKEDVIKCIDTLTDEVDLVVTMTKSSRSPWFNMVSRNDKGNLDLVCANNDIYTRRQDTPTCFDLTTVAYVSRPRYVLNNESMWAGNVGGIEIPAERGVDIDTILDFKYAELLLKEQSIQNSSGN